MFTSLSATRFAAINRIEEAFAISNNLFKKTAALMLVIPMLLMYAGGLNKVDAAEGYHESETTLTYYCESVTNFEMPVTINANVPESVEPGEEFTLTNSSTTVTLPENVVGTLGTLLQAESISGEATLFNILAENEDAEVNVAADPIPIPETEVPDSGTLTFSVPGEGGVDAGPFVAGDEGNVTISAGAIDTNLIVHGPLGDSPIPASCSPLDGQDLTLNEIQIEEPGDPVDEVEPEIALNGENPMELEVGSTYEEPGATAEDNVDGDLTDSIEISGEVNTEEAGEYTITYTVTDEAGNTATEERTVNVVEPEEEPGDPVDEVEPEIALNGENPMELEVGSTYEEPGATAEDNVDGDLTDSIEISGEVNTEEAGEYTITYTVTDEAGNTATEERTVNVVEPEEEPGDPVDEVEPEIALNGENPMELEVGSTYEEPGATAEDNVDGDLTDSIEISGEVNTEEAGEYTITYILTDEAGNTATEERTVNVVEPEEEPGDPGAGGLWFAAEGSPAADLGETGDLYLDTSSNDVYMKDEDGWEKVGNLSGDNGIPGATWTVGEGAPDTNEGNNGDLYLDKDTGDVYLKTVEGWNIEANIKGEDGEDGQDGQDGKNGKQGPAGDCDCDDSNDNNNGAAVGENHDNDNNNGSAVGSNNDNYSGTTFERSKGNSSTMGGELPKTASNTPLIILLGSLMAVAGGALIFRKRSFKVG
ncbi:immunoglobulin-like domain-containing protein [Virgibacillus natechei]